MPQGIGRPGEEERDRGKRKKKKKLISWSNKNTHIHSLSLPSYMGICDAPKTITIVTSKVTDDG